MGIGFAPFAHGASQEFPVPPPPFTEGIYPCNNCHASMEVNRKKRELKEEHTKIRMHHADSREKAEDFLQQHFLEMTAEEKKEVIARLERRYYKQSNTEENFRSARRKPFLKPFTVMAWSYPGVLAAGDACMNALKKIIIPVMPDSFTGSEF